jgi:hypothetical protein
MAWSVGGLNLNDMNKESDYLRYRKSWRVKFKFVAGSVSRTIYTLVLLGYNSFLQISRVLRIL